MEEHFKDDTSDASDELKGQNRQKQPLEVFCKKRCSSKFRKFHRKTSVLKSLFNRPVTLLKIDSNTGVFL